MLKTKAIDHYPHPDGPSLVLLHGGGLNRAMWWPQVDLLKDDFSLLLLDLPGHGSLRATGFSLDAAVVQVAEAIARNAHGQVITVGLSLGGYVAMAHAAKYPDQVAGLVASGCSVQYTGLMNVLARLSVASMRVLSEDRYGRMQQHLLRRSASAAVADAIAHAGFSAQGGRDSLRALLGQDFFARLQDYTGAVLIVNGEHDGLNRRYAARSAVLQRGAMEIIRGSSHLCSLEQPLAFADVVRKFSTCLAHGET